jgi:hypothetical protein
LGIVRDYLNHMTKGCVPCPVPDHDAKGLWARPLVAFLPVWPAIGSLFRLAGKAGILILLLGAMSLPLVANAAPAPATQPAAGDEDFGRYLAGHQDDLGPFFSDNAGDIFRLGVPVVMGMMGWVIIFTMLVGWGIDVLMSRGFSFFYAPAFAEVKRALIYATGRLFLSVVYTCLLSLAIVFSLKFPYAGIVMAIAVLVLVAVALAAQIVWILYLYRTAFSVSVVFYLAIIAVHSIVGVLIAKSVVGLRASSAVTEFVDQSITPRLRADTEGIRRQLADAQSARNAAKAKVADLQNQVIQAKSDEEQLRQEIDEKKNSDIYVFSRIVQARARHDLASAHDQIAVFLAKYPASSLSAQAHAQLTQINDELAAEDAQKKQADADTARASAQARSDLLARAGKGEVTLSEMRQALIGKTRAQVKSLLGLPPQTASDQWGYPQQMIVNPLTNEKSGLLVNFSEGTVQGVDYNRNRITP